MGDRQSKLQEMEKQGVELINCGHHISVADINRIYHAKTELPESSKRLFNKAVQFVAKTDDSILRDCALELDDRNNQLHIMFYAGDLGNQYVMALKDDNEVDIICTAKSRKRTICEKLGISNSQQDSKI